jgi:uncharacterized protein
MKVVLWIVVVLAVLVGLRLYNAAKAKRRGEAARQSPRPASPADTMVRCVRCGVFLPRAEAKPGPAGLTCGDPGCAQRH